MVKIIKIIENDIITGVKYGVVVVPEPVNTVPEHIMQKYKKAQTKVTKCRTHNTKQTRIHRK